MPRELKFRAWHKMERRMFELQMLDTFWGVGRLQWFDDQPDGSKAHRGRDVDLREIEVMQFTGLHDSEGHEIYEGDIVHYMHPASDEWLFGVVSFENGTFTVGRMWDDGTREWTSIEVLATPNTWENGKLVVPIEVIGNIYEHPELMEAETRCK